MNLNGTVYTIMYEYKSPLKADPTDSVHEELFLALLYITIVV